MMPDMMTVVPVLVYVAMVMIASRAIVMLPAGGRHVIVGGKGAQGKERGQQGDDEFLDHGNLRMFNEC